MRKKQKKGNVAMSRFGFAVIVCLVFASVASAVELAPFQVFYPSAIELSMQGVKVEDKSFLVAGTNVDATVKLGGYAPDWVEWSLGTDDYGSYGKFRHKIEQICIMGHPAAEIEDWVETITNGKDKITFPASQFKGSLEGEVCPITAAKYEIIINIPVNDKKVHNLPGVNPELVSIEACKDAEYCCQAEVKFKLPKGSGYHGQYFWTVEIDASTEYEIGSIKNGERQPISTYSYLTYHFPHPESVYDPTRPGLFCDLRSMLLLTNEQARVFFAKDGKDDGKTPNWFTYWGEDGAVPQLKGDAEYAKVPNYDHLFTLGNENRGILDPSQVGSGWGAYNPQKNKIALFAPAGDAHYYAKKVGDGYERRWRDINQMCVPFEINVKHQGTPYEFADPTTFGIYTVENVIAHESMHKKLQDEYNRETGNLSKKKELSTSDATRLKEMDHDLQLMETYSGDWYSGGWKIKIKVLPVIDPKINRVAKWMPFCDHLTDNMERRYDMDETNLDKYGLGDPASQAYKNDEYKAYGDEEFLCVLSGWKANHESSQVFEEKDWAFPGHQSYLPPPFKRMPKDGDSSAVKSASNLRSAPLLQAVDEPSTNEPEEPGTMSCASLTPQLQKAVVGPKFSGIAYDFHFDVTGTNKVEIIGCLSDLHSNVVARAMVRQEFTPANNTCTLFFDGREIYESGKDGPYMLLGLVFREYDDLDVYFNSAVSGFDIPNVEGKYDDFLRAEAVVLENDIRKTEREDGLEIGVDVECQHADTNELIIEVATAGGKPFGQYWQSLACVAGTNHFAITVPADAIRDAGGSCKISKVILQHDQVNVDVVDFLSPPRPRGIPSLRDSYGPFVPGEKVELKFPEGAAWTVTGLPMGLKWDAKLPGVTGVPTKPGTNTVAFTWTDKTVTPNVIYKDSATFIVGPLPVLSVQTAGEGTGKVSGAGAYAANKKVTLKATADTKDAAATAKTPVTVKSVFAGWYDAAGDLVSQAPSLSYVMPPNDVTLQARFIPASNDWATVDCATEAGSVRVVTNETKVAIAPITVTPSGGSLPTVKVAGLPTGLKFTAKDILKKGSKTEVDIPANTIYGTPTKGGVYNATVTVTTAGKASVVRTIKFVIRTASDYVVDADWDPVQGKVTGVGIGNPGKKVTLKATANKGYVFNGWYEGEGLGGLEGLVTQAASYSFSMPSNDVSFTAKFVTAEEDKASIGATVDGLALEPWVSKDETRALTTNVWAGVSLEWPVAARALSETTVAVSGLPSGLKFAAKPVTSKVGSGKTAVTVTNVAANTIYGAPSAASKTMKAKDGSVTVVPTAVKVTVTTAGKNKQTYQIDMTVDPLPAWAVGTFAGPSYDGDDTNGVASVTVATSGKITAKQPVAGKAVSFSATCFDRYDAEADAYVATLTAKVGTNVVTNVMAVMAAESGTGFVEADLFDAWQHNWKVEPWKEVGKSFDKREVSYEEEGVRVTLKFSASGTAKVAGEFAKLDDEGNYVYNKYGVLQTVTATGSATLLPTLGEGGETRYIAFVYLAPKDLPAHARCVEVAAEVVE